MRDERPPPKSRARRRFRWWWAQHDAECTREGRRGFSKTARAWTLVGARAGHYQTQGPHTGVKGDAIKTCSLFGFIVERWRCRLQKLEGRAFQLHGVERLYTEKNRHSEVVNDERRRVRREQKNVPATVVQNPDEQEKKGAKSVQHPVFPSGRPP